MNQCSGVIVENDADNAHIVLTSANLIRHPREKDLLQRPREKGLLDDTLADSLKVGSCLFIT